MQNFYRNKLSTYLITNIKSVFLPCLLAIFVWMQAGLPAFAAEGQTINNTRISFIADNLSLKDVFSIIEHKTEFIIGYDNVLDVNKRVSLRVNNKPVSQILQQLLIDYKGTISQVDDNHVLIKVDKAPLRQKPQIKIVPQVRIAGKVVDENNQPIPGVSVYEKVSHKGTATDVNGNFVFNAEQGSTLVFSFVGYESQEVLVGNQTEINIKLKPSSNILNEVVAIGYQTVRKSDFTGAVSSVKASELNLTAPTVGQALVGKVAGVQVQQVSGAPYQSTKIAVRGVGSLLASSDPLYVIDGYASGNDLFINPEDIESIDILKDAASAAIYGSRAAGGVVLITTKHAKENSPAKFEYDYQFGVNQLAKKVDLLNGDQFAQLVIDGRNDTYKDLWVTGGHVWNDAMYSDPNATRVANVGNASAVQIPTSFYDFPSQSLIHQQYNTDWQNTIYRNALSQTHNFSFSGSSKGTRYYLSAGYQDQQGIMLSTGQQKINLRANLEGNIGTRLKINANIAYTQNTNQETQDGRWDHSPALGALIYPPNFPAYNPDGSIATNLVAALSPAYGFQSIENPLATLEFIKISRVGQRATYNAQATYTILDGFTFKANLGMQTYGENYNYYLPTGISNGAFAPYSSASVAAAKAVQQTIAYQDQLGEFTLNYTKQLGKHHIDGLLGYTAQKTINNVLTVQGLGFQNDNVPNITGAAPSLITLITSGAPEGTQPTLNSAYTLLSYLGRVNDNYAGKYFLSGSFRTDGSSRFGVNTKYGVFPSVSAGWNLSDESFYHSWLGDQSTVKLRASWGLSGNNNIGNYSTQQVLNAPTSVVFGSPGTVNSAITAGSIQDQNLGWESTSQFNFGADLGLLHGRLFIIANYYLSYSYKLLFNEPISAISGTSSITTNLNNSKVSNKGFDIQVDAKPIVSKDFTLDVSGNISINRNKVLDLGGGNTIITNGAERSYLTSITQAGYPIGMFYGYRVAGMVKASDLANIATDQAHYNASTQSYPAGYKPVGPPRSTFSTLPLEQGDLYFKDTNGDGVINSKDAGIIGNPYPKFTYGFALNATYKKFFFSTAFNGSYGNQVLDGQDYYLYNMEGSGNQYEDVANRYRSPSIPGNGIVYRASRGGTESNSTRLSTFYLQDGSFLRNTNTTLGYVIKSDFLTRNLGLSVLKFYGSVNNGFTITKYKGYNPEVNYDYTFKGSSGTNLTPGIDYGVYPLVRSYNIGVKATF
jgi:TonB-linked SusC/RagA family outer membrane protein